MIMIFSFAMYSLSAFADDEDDYEGPEYEEEIIEEEEDEDEGGTSLDTSDKSENKGKRNDEGKVYVYKSPIKETTGDGGELSFIARGENETEITWFICKDKTSYTLEEAMKKYEDLQVLYWEAKEGVTLKHVPKELDGWKIKAKFDGDGGPVYTDSALITVNDYTVDQYWFDYWHKQKVDGKRVYPPPVFWWNYYDSYGFSY
jgi:hypothetical protein